MSKRWSRLFLFLFFFLRERNRRNLPIWDVRTPGSYRPNGPCHAEFGSRMISTRLRPQPRLAAGNWIWAELIACPYESFGKIGSSRTSSSLHWMKGEMVGLFAKAVAEGHLTDVQDDTGCSAASEDAANTRCDLFVGRRGRRALPSHHLSHMMA